MRECRLHQRERWISRSLPGAPKNVETNRQYGAPSPVTALCLESKGGKGRLASGGSDGSAQMPVGRIASWIFVVYALCVTVATKTQGVEGFASRGTGLQAFRQVYLGDKILGRIEIALSMVDKGNNNDDSKSQQSFDDFGEDDVGSGGASMLEDLDWRVNKLRLEEANTRRFLKSGPRFLPYEECCKWVQAFGRWHSKEDW